MSNNDELVSPDPIREDDPDEAPNRRRLALAAGLAIAALRSQRRDADGDGLRIDRV